MSAIIIGIGFRAQASVDELRSAISAALDNARITNARLATPDDKAGASALIEAAQHFGLAIVPVSAPALCAQAARCITQSAMVSAKRSVGSVAEAAALAVAGEGATLRGPRVVGPTRMVTIAIATQFGAEAQS